MLSAVWTIKALTNSLSHATTPRIQARTTEWWTQARALISPLWDYRFPLSPSLPCSNNPCRRASLLTSITAYPLQRWPFSLWPWGEVTESGRSEVVLPTATTGLSQKSVCQKPCGPRAWRPHEPLEVRGDRDPPVLVNNGLSQSHRLLLLKYSLWLSYLWNSSFK